MNNVEKALIFRDSQFYWHNKIKEYEDAIEKLSHLSAYTVDSISVPLSAICCFGDASPASIAKALLYPAFERTMRELFKDHLPGYIERALKDYESEIPDMDIHFIDQIDHIDKHVVLVPNQEIDEEFIRSIEKVAAAHAKARSAEEVEYEEQLCIGMLQGKVAGTDQELPESMVPIYDGEDFWERFSGSRDFYNRLMVSHINTVAYNCAEKLQESLKVLEEEIKASDIV